MTFNPHNDKSRQIHDPRKFHLMQPMYLKYMRPLGMLCQREVGCHALFTYAMNARKAWEYERSNLLAYEGDPDTAVNYLDLLKSTAFLYDVHINSLISHWSCVDAQLQLLRLPAIPNEERYRFNRPHVVTP